jgi:hypothetical protein
MSKFSPCLINLYTGCAWLSGNVAPRSLTSALGEIELHTPAPLSSEMGFFKIENVLWEARLFQVRVRVTRAELRANSIAPCSLIITCYLTDTTSL